MGPVPGAVATDVKKIRKKFKYSSLSPLYDAFPSVSALYEGRSINKLQNDIILLNFKI